MVSPPDGSQNAPPDDSVLLLARRVADLEAWKGALQRNGLEKVGTRGLFTPKDETNAGIRQVAARADHGHNIADDDLLYVNIKKHGAVDGGDIYTPLTKAIAQADAQKKSVWIPGGTYTLSAPVTLSAARGIVGPARGQVVINVPDSSGYAFISTVAEVEFRNLTIVNKGPATIGGGIKFAYGNYGQVIGCYISLFYDGIYVDDAVAIDIDHCLLDGVHSVINYQETTRPDSGDTSITNSWLTSATAGYGILWGGGGGLRVVNNKFLSNDTHIFLNPAPASTTTGIYIYRNSMELSTSYGIRVQRQSGTPVINNIEIGANEIYLTTGDAIVLEDAAATIPMIVGNDIATASGASRGIVAKNGVFGAQIQSNRISTCGVGIRVEAGCIAYVGESNSYYGCSVDVQDLNTPNQAVDGHVTYTRSRAIAALTSAVTYTNFLQVDMHDYSAVTLELTFNLLLSGVSRASRQMVLMINEGGASACVVNVVSDVVGAAAIDVQFDVASVTGSVYFGLRRNAAAGGTQLDGHIFIRLIGHPKAVAKL